MKRSLVLLALVSLCSCREGLRNVASSASVSPVTLAFGAVTIGQKKPLKVTVTNDSLYPIDVTDLQVAPPFSVSTQPPSIGASGSTEITVDFTPPSAADYDETLTIALSATDTPSLTVEVTGSGTTVIIPPPPTTCDTTGCPSGQGCCGSACVDTTSDPTHCGAGCSVCGTGQTCNSGVCTTPVQPPDGCDTVTAPCPGSEKCCNHACVDVSQTGGLCPCKGTGNTTFAAGTLIIPMDACFQPGKEVSSPPGACDANAVSGGSDAPLKAYGLIFFLLRHQVTIYMAIYPAKTTPGQSDLTLDSATSGEAPVQRYNWSTGAFTPLTVATSSIGYRGGPFLIDASQHDRVLQLLKSDPDFAQFRSSGNITIHSTNADFSTVIAKSITSVPSQIALLVPPNDSTGPDSDSQILVRYLASAGLDFSGAGGTPAAHGQIYDQLQESDFLQTYAQSNLKAGGYKLLWSPHWDGTTSNTPAQLQSIGDYVAAGNDLFAECAAIAQLEGMTSQRGGGGSTPGSAATQFLTTAGMSGNLLPNLNHSGTSLPVYTSPFSYGALTSPFAQVGNFPLATFLGAVTDFQPNTATSSVYRPSVAKFLSGTGTDGKPTNIFAALDGHVSGRGTVVYLGGHDYSYGGEYDNTSITGAGTYAGITAGSRMVLNTLFSLGTNNICQP